MTPLSRSVEAIHEAGARLAALIGTIGAVGSMIHRGYDLANKIHPPGANPGRSPAAAP